MTAFTVPVWQRAVLAAAMFIIATLGWLATRDRPAVVPMPEPAGRAVLYYRNPMDPSVTSAVPAQDSMGMDYVPVYADESRDATLITVPAEVSNTLGVRTAQATRNTLARRIDTVGYVGYDESRIGHVHLRTEGWVEQLAVHTTGDRVEQGQLLFTLYAPALVNAQQEYLEMLDRGNQRLAEAARHKLRALGVSAGQIEALGASRTVERGIGVYAHHAGVVAQLNVREGMFIEPATEALTIVSLDSVWIIADVFEQQLSWVAPGQEAVARTFAYPGRNWTGTVDFVYPGLDERTRSLRVRLRFDNTDQALQPNMFAHVTILAAPRNDVLTVPQDALIRDADGDRVIVALGEGRFAPRPVRAGIESGNRVEIVEGLDTGESVVVSAQFLLDSEASLRAGLRRMDQDADAGNTRDAEQRR